MLWGAFAAMLLSGAVFYVHGIAQAVEHRERMQDAADAAAMASAVMHAGGMNLIATMNMLMAALLAILVAFKITETIALMTMIVAGASASINPAMLAAVAPLNQVRNFASNAHEKLEQPVRNGLGALNGMSKAIAGGVPAASELRAFDAARHFAPPVDVGFVVPARMRLPVEDGSYDDLCEKAGELAFDLALLPFNQNAALAPVAAILSSVGGDLTRAGAGWFCGSQGAPAPKTSQRVEVHRPELAAVVACREADVDDAEARCEEAERVVRASTPDEETGRCQSECGDAGPYATRAALARTQCNPGRHSGLAGFLWQEQVVLLEYGRRAPQQPRRLLSRRVVEGPFLKRGDRSPCPGGFGSGGTDPDAVVCSDAPGLGALAQRGAPSEVRAREVTRIFGCTVTEEITRQPEQDDAGQQKSNKHVPQQLEGDLAMGDGAFQLRGVALGRVAEDIPTRVLALASPTPEAAAGGGAGGAQHAAVSDPTARIAIAQAEYYFHEDDGRAPASVMLWQTRWRARLRRVALPSGNTGGAGNGGNNRGQPSVDLGRACRLAGSAGGRCGTLTGLLPGLDALVAH